jgi:hypothetical protein
MSAELTRVRGVRLHLAERHWLVRGFEEVRPLTPALSPLRRERES